MENQNDNTSLRTDPITMYLVVRTSLNMSVGKVSAQVGHAVGLLTSWYYEEWERRQDNGFGTGEFKFTDRQMNLFLEWMQKDYGKVVLAADDKEFEKLEQEFREPAMVVVKDNGYTELEPGSKTVLGFLPMRKSERTKLLKRLQLLK